MIWFKLWKLQTWYRFFLLFCFVLFCLDIDKSFAVPYFLSKQNTHKQMKMKYESPHWIMGPCYHQYYDCRKYFTHNIYFCICITEKECSFMCVTASSLPESSMHEKLTQNSQVEQWPQDVILSYRVGKMELYMMPG